MSYDLIYNKDAKIAGVSVSAWSRLIPEDWLSNYKIICVNNCGYKADNILSLGINYSICKDFTTQKVINTQEFQSLANEELAGYKFVVFLPAEMPKAVSRERLLPNKKELWRFEDKKIFRDLFYGKVPIAEFRQVLLSELVSQDPEHVYERLTGDLGQVLVVQSRIGSGGRGTFIVRTPGAFNQALRTIQSENQSDELIISRFIDGTERSIQAVATASGVFCGPIQQQLVRNDELVNSKSRGGMYFCGARIAEAETPEHIRRQIVQAVNTIGGELGRSGYKGLFGVDFIVSANDEVFVLEINARPTGVLPLIKEQPDAVPLYLLHILELACEPYSITESSNEPIGNGPDSMLILFNQQAVDMCFDPVTTTGNYKITDQGLQKLDGSPRWNPDADLMLQLFCSQGFPAAPNLKLCNIFMKQTGFDESGALTEPAQQILALLRQHLVKA